MRKVASAWLLADAAVAAQVHIVLMQEVSMVDKDFDSFRKTYYKRGYRVYGIPGAPGPGGNTCRGVITMIAKALRSRKVWAKSEEQGQTLATAVADTLLVNTYSPPGRGNAQWLLEDIARAAEVEEARAWLAVGDWTAILGSITPPSQWAEVRAVREDGRLAPTRWAEQKGYVPRCIDYAITYGTRVHNMKFGDIEASDHKLVTFELAPPRDGYVTEYRPRPTHKLSRPAGPSRHMGRGDYPPVGGRAGPGRARRPPSCGALPLGARERAGPGLGRLHLVRLRDRARGDAVDGPRHVAAALGRGGRHPRPGHHQGGRLQRGGQ